MNAVPSPGALVLGKDWSPLALLLGRHILKTRDSKSNQCMSFVWSENFEPAFKNQIFIHNDRLPTFLIVHLMVLGPHFRIAAVTQCLATPASFISEHVFPRVPQSPHSLWSPSVHCSHLCVLVQSFDIFSICFLLPSRFLLVLS